MIFPDASIQIVSPAVQSHVSDSFENPADIENIVIAIPVGIDKPIVRRCGIDRAGPKDAAGKNGDKRGFSRHR
jgi:hypothetical protein